MSTDTNNTNPADVSDVPNPGPDATAPVESNAATSSPAESPPDDDDLQPPELAAATKPVARSVAESGWDDDDDLEPGDDIGNRIDGPAHHERTTTDAEVAAAAGKSKRRHKKKKGEGAGTEQAEASGDQRKAKPNRPGPPQRERPAFRVGEEVFGKVVEITDEAIFIDLSGKAKAIFDRSELSPENLPQIGDHFVANVHGDGSRGGMVILTHNNARAEAAKQPTEAALTSGEPVPGLVTGVIKGGVEVDIAGLRAFAPASHVELRLGSDLSHLVGKRFPFKVMKYAKNGREIVLSRRESLEQEAASVRREALALLEPNSIVDAVVRSVVEWGVFVAIPSAANVEGLIHITEASHDRSARLSAQFKPGETIQVKVLRIDEKGKLWLSRKAVSGDPWEKAAEQFTVGSRHKGRVARMQPFGAFIELAPGIDGLIRTGDLSLRRVNDPSEIVKLGDELDVIVVHIDASQRKIALHPAPPEGEDEQHQKVAPHRTLRVAVVSAEPAGLVVRVLGVTGGAARGFIPAGHTGTARGTDLRKEFPVGTVLEAKVIELDSRRGECKLSIRALKEDSEKAAFNEYRAKVARESKFGTFGDLFAKRNGS